MTSTEVLPDGVTVAQLILVQFVLVQIQVRQPFFLPSQRTLPPIFHTNNLFPVFVFFLPLRRFVP